MFIAVACSYKAQHQHAAKPQSAHRLKGAEQGAAGVGKGGQRGAAALGRQSRLCRVAGRLVSDALRLGRVAGRLVRGALRLFGVARRAPGVARLQGCLREGQGEGRRQLCVSCQLENPLGQLEQRHRCAGWPRPGLLACCLLLQGLRAAGTPQRSPNFGLCSLPQSPTARPPTNPRPACLDAGLLGVALGGSRSLVCVARVQGGLQAVLGHGAGVTLASALSQLAVGGGEVGLALVELGGEGGSAVSQGLAGGLAGRQPGSQAGVGIGRGAVGGLAGRQLGSQPGVVVGERGFGSLAGRQAGLALGQAVAAGTVGRECDGEVVLGSLQLAGARGVVSRGFGGQGLRWV